ncbi:MAG: metallophosphoesterase [Clostridia bacterium]|nr:metallophosphoesterase [Clostridia bacterium]
MKVYIKSSLAVLLVCLCSSLIILGSYALYILNCSSPIGSRVVVDKENNILSVNDDKDIKVLQLSDTQITALGDALKALDAIQMTVEMAQPDLIVLTGDNLMNGSKKFMLKKYIRFIDEFEIPWAPVFGNHDYKTDMTMDTQCKLYESGKYCLFQKGNVTDSYGNYYYNIHRNGNPIYSLVFMDNAISTTEHHLEWYRNTINSISNECGKVLPSWTFFHLPLVETYYAYRQYYYNDIPLDGEMRDGGVAYQKNDAGLFDTAKELGSATAMIYGHNHRNTFIADYKGIKLCYGIKTGRASYHDEDIQGGCLYTIKPDNTFTIDRIFLDPEDRHFIFK